MKKMDSITNPITGESKQIVIKGLWKHWWSYAIVGTCAALIGLAMDQCYNQGVIDHLDEELMVLKDLDLIHFDLVQ